MKQHLTLTTTSTSQARRWSLSVLALGLALPSIILFIVRVAVGQVSLLTVFSDILQQQFAEGHNLFLLSLLGLIPFVALCAMHFFTKRRLSPRRFRCVSLGGLLGILLLMVPSHAAVWYSLYGSGHASSTSVLAFLFIPFYCLVTLGLGLLVGWLVSLHPRFR
jgi:hypothetical protein